MAKLNILKDGDETLRKISRPVEAITPRILTLLDDMLEIQTEITSMRGTSLVFTQRIVNAENTLLNEAEVLVVCVDPLKMKPRALPKSIVAEFKQ